MKAKKSFSFGKVLLILAAIVQGAQYVYAFQAVHAGGDLPGLAAAGGVLAGGVVVGSVAFSAGRLPFIRAKLAKRAAWAAFLILLTVSPFILTPINWYSMTPGLRAAIGGYAWALAGLVASVPELAIALVAFSDRDLLPATPAALPAGRPARAAGKAAKAAGRPAGSAAQPAKIYACNYPGCEYTTEKQPALAAHISHHSRRARVDSLAGALFEQAKGGKP